MKALVSPLWLHNNLSNANLTLLDASMDKVVGKTPIVYETPTYIPNSRKLDLTESFCNTESDELHALPTEEQFKRACQELAISDDRMVVIYDNQGLYSAPRAWWIFKTMGIDNVAVLDGGLPQWIEEDFDVVSSLITSTSLSLASELSITRNPERVCDADYVMQRLHDKNTVILDARSAERFSGQAPELRPGVRSGHIPNSINLPFLQVLDGHKLKSQSELAALFRKWVPNGNHLICSCGSGITACILLLAADVAGIEGKRLYDGSWADWGGKMHLPIEKG